MSDTEGAIESAVADAPDDACEPGPDTVAVRYWAAARSAAGRSEDRVRGRTVAEALAEVRRTHAGNSRLLRVLAVSSVLVGDRPLGSRDPASVVLADGDSIEILPPFAGGSVSR